MSKKIKKAKESYDPDATGRDMVLIIGDESELDPNGNPVIIEITPTEYEEIFGSKPVKDKDKV